MVSWKQICDPSHLYFFFSGEGFWLWPFKCKTSGGCLFFFKKNMVEMVEFHLQMAEPLFEVAKNCSDKIFTSKSRRFSQVFSIFVSRLSWMFSCKQIFIPHTRTSDFWLWRLKNSNHFGELVNKKSWSFGGTKSLTIFQPKKKVTFALHLLHWILVQTSRRVGWAIRPTADWWTNELVATRCEAVMDFVCGCWKTKF